MPYKNPKDNFANRKMKRRVATIAQGFVFIDKPAIKCTTCKRISLYNGSKGNRHYEGCKNAA